MAVADQVPAVMVPTVAISVPTNLEAAIEPASMALVTFEAPMAVTPAFEIVISPLIATEAGTLETLPTKILPEVKAASLEKSIAAEALTSALTITPVPIAVAKEPVPEPVTSPVKVMVWSPVLVPEEEPEKLEAARVEEAVSVPVTLVLPLTFNLYAPGAVVPMPTLPDD